MPLQNLLPYAANLFFSRPRTNKFLQAFGEKQKKKEKENSHFFPAPMAVCSSRTAELKDFFPSREYALSQQLLNGGLLHDCVVVVVVVSC